MMCHDGASMESRDADVEMRSRTSLLSKGWQDEDSQKKARFRIMIHDLLADGYNVALLNGLSLQDTKVKTNNDGHFTRADAV